jgi:hypothetical protein
VSKDLDKVAVFEALRPILRGCSKNLTIVTDDEDCFYLDTQHTMKNKKRLFFGAVQIKKNYVSYHLMPVYVNPSLLDSISEPLKQRMHGKSCFNFRRIEPELVDELTSLTEAGYRFYVDEGYIQRDA